VEAARGALALKEASSLQGKRRERERERERNHREAGRRGGER
jgi:hypothetical protein